MTIPTLDTILDRLEAEDRARAKAEALAEARRLAVEIEAEREAPRRKAPCGQCACCRAARAFAR